jgi:hypothetical protein
VSKIFVLCCAECDTPVVTTTGGGSHCLHCDYPPSMQDTRFIRVEGDKVRGAPELEEVATLLRRCRA